MEGRRKCSGGDHSDPTLTPTSSAMQARMPDLELVCRRRRFVQSLKYMLKTWRLVEGGLLGRQEPMRPAMRPIHLIIHQKYIQERRSELNLFE